jgi:hypothetical protein
MAGLPRSLPWRTALIIFALLNLKSLPLSWHIGLLYNMFSNWKSVAHVRKRIASSPPSSSVRHPIFEPVSITSRAPLMEIDYNIHKSNSTYFRDLDQSRMALCSKIFVHALKPTDLELEKEGLKGPLIIPLGSVHTSFHKEIKPYEKYEVRSRLLGWDQKWMVIISYFVRPKKYRKPEVVLASALSKYVVKKGRMTIPPERIFRTAGWLPERPADESVVLVNHTSSTSTPQEGLTEPIPTALIRGAEDMLEKIASIPERPNDDSAGSWDWQSIEDERLRGLRIAEQWLALDKQLMQEHEN